MKKYLVSIVETLEKQVEVEAEDQYQAYEIAEEKVNKAEIVLDADDFTGRDIEVIKEVV